MKKILLIIFVLSIMLMGCTDDTVDIEIEDTAPDYEIDNIPQDADDNLATPDITPTPAPKISSDFHDAPTAEDIKNETGKDIAEVLLQDTLTYEIKHGNYFAVALEEDASKQYRWLLASDDNKFKYVEEVHINGYRVFILDAVEMGDESLLFELTQNTSTLVETLSYQLKFIS